MVPVTLLQAGPGAEIGALGHHWPRSPATRRTARAARLWGMDHARFATWLRGYLDAWRTGERAAVEALFTEDATYAFAPFQPPLIGRQAIIAMWLKDPDKPNSWSADYRPLAIDGEVAVAEGETSYRKADGASQDVDYRNIFVCEFAPDGRCRSFVEWYMTVPQAREQEDEPAA